MNLQSIISKFDHCKILVIGDLMLDEYVWGDVDRISPEAPVQIVAVRKEEYTLGGAGNVVSNLAALGASVAVAGVIGEADFGKHLLKMFHQCGADTGGVIVEPGRITTLKTRIIAANQHVLRIDRETQKDISTETFDQLKNFVQTRIPESDAVIFSDYGKGVLTDDMLDTIILTAKKYCKPVVGDPKRNDFSKYSGATLLTPNRKEASQASGIDIRDDTTLHQAAEKILATAQLDALLITLGKDGIALFREDESAKSDAGLSVIRIRSQARQVYDVSGAGDTVVSVFALALASGADMKQAAEIANTAAGIVVGKIGTATVMQKEILEELKVYPVETLSKFRSPEDLPALIQGLRKQNKRIVLTNGCFDLLHVGHVMLLSASRKYGDVLIVAIDSDDSVRSLKGEGRPVIAEKERIRMLAALDSVDYVTVFSSEQLTEIIEIICPDVLTKGSNYTSEEVFGRGLVEKYGGRIVLFPVIESVSSTGIINAIKQICT